MNESLDKTFSVWKKDALTMIKNKYDQIFLDSMKSDRVGSFGGVDKKKLIKIAEKQNISKKKLPGKNVIKQPRSKR